MIVRDLFCGAGGWSMGARANGLDVTGYDNNGDAITTYVAAGFTGVFADLTHFAPHECDLLLASPPCQPFSKATRDSQGRADTRAMLPLVVATWAELVRPTAIAVEQVEGAASVIVRLAAMLVNMGYRVVLREVNAECFGVPQTRRRIVLMAHTQRTPGVPKATHSVFDRRHPERLQRGVLPWVSMAEALGVDPESSMGDVKTSNGTVRSALQPAATVMAGMDNGNYQWVHNRPSPTIVSEFRPQVVAAPGYRTTMSRQDQPNSVMVTTAQAATLQGFPPDYPWTGSLSARYRQIGNAFPPPVAAAVIKEML